MFIPEDRMRELRHVEDHSTLSVVIVSVAMIVAALAGLSIGIA
jgi:hypothetical protein